MYQTCGFHFLPGRPKQRGFVLILFAISCAVLIGFLGMAIDLGRLYLVKSESQNFVDSTALAAAARLDGTQAGIISAANIVAQNMQKYDLASKPFTNVATRFATSVTGPWYEANVAPARSRFVRVRSSANVPMYFMPLVAAKQNGIVAASGTAAQVEKKTFTEGIFPFSPFAHSPVGPHYGLTPGQSYTLGWVSKPKLNSNNVCPGDNLQSIIDLSNAAGSEEHGFIEENSASLIRQTIINDYQTVTRTVGDLVDLTGGWKSTMSDALQARVNQDSDPYSANYATYMANHSGNGRRLIGVPINDGGTPPGQNHRIVSIGLFFLYPAAAYSGNPQKPWCAEYVGAYVEGANNKGVEESGAWVVRLVR